MHHRTAQSGKPTLLLRSQWKHRSAPGWLCSSHGNKKEVDWRYCLSAWLYWQFLLCFTTEEWKQNCELNEAFMKTIKLLFKIFKGNTFTKNSFFFFLFFFKSANINWAIICTHPMPFLPSIGMLISSREIDLAKIWDPWLAEQFAASFLFFFLKWCNVCIAYSFHNWCSR